MATAFDSFSDLFEEKKPKKKKQPLIVKQYPAAKKTILEDTETFVKETLPEEPQKTPSSFQKISDKIAADLYQPPREVTLAPPEPPPVVNKPPITIGKTLRFLRKLRSWIASPFIDKMVQELNTRLETFQKNYDDKFAQLSYNAYTTNAVGFGGATTVVQQISGSVSPKFYNNSVSSIDSKVLVTLNDNDILDDSLTTIKQLLNGTDEPLGISASVITQDGEGDIISTGTTIIPFSTINLPIGTNIYSSSTGDYTTSPGDWIIGKTVNQNLNGKIFVQIKSANVGFSEDDILLGEEDEVLSDVESNVIIGI